MKIWLLPIALIINSISFGMNSNASFVIKDITSHHIIDPVVKIVADYIEKRPLFTFAAQDKEMFACVSFSPDGTKLASGLTNGKINIWDMQTGKLLQVITSYKENSVDSMSFSPDGSKLVCGSTNGEIKLWDVQTGKMLNMFKARMAIASVAFSPDGTRLASGSNRGTINLWDVKKRRKIKAFTDKGLIKSVSFSFDGTQLTTVSVNGTIKQWDVQTGKLLNTSPIDSEILASSVSFSPDGTKLASGLDSNKITISNTQTGKLINTLIDHESLITSLNFSYDGTKLASVSTDKTIKVWLVPGVIKGYLKNLKDNLQDEDKKAQLILLGMVAGAIEKEQSALIQLWMKNAANSFPDFLKLALKDVISQEKKN